MRPETGDATAVAARANQHTFVGGAGHCTSIEVDLELVLGEDAIGRNWRLYFEIRDDLAFELLQQLARAIRSVTEDFGWWR